MNKWENLNDFSEYDGNIPCPLCSGDSAKTIMGNHWKCSKCAHVFNQDGSEIGTQCYCETCHEKTLESKNDLELPLKIAKKPSKKKKTKKIKSI